MCHEGTLGEQISYEYVFFCFFPKKPGARCMYHEPKIIKNPGKIVSRTIPQDFPSPRFFWKKPSKREKNTILCGARMSLENEFPWRTNFPGERISLENESLENPLGKIVVRNIMVRQPPGKSQFVSMCWKSSGEKTPLENPNLFILCAGTILVRKPPRKTAASKPSAVCSTLF